MGYGKHNRSKGGNSSRGRTDNLAREDESLPLDQEPEDEAPVPKVQLAMWVCIVSFMFYSKPMKLRRTNCCFSTHNCVFFV
jgi:hypothetical protein